MKRSFPSLTRTLRFTLLAGVARAFADTIPEDLTLTRFSGPDVTPCVACLAVSAQGEVFAGVDLNGSLGKGPGKGRIVRLVDKDRDGVADAHTVFATVDNPRGLLSVGRRLYVLHTAFGPDGKSTGMDLVVFEDADNDGRADGAPRMLIRGICSAASINARGTDHSTNGIRMGIDGWIYIAVGDFGFHEATGADGTKLTLLGGGIVRVRPDGSEMEFYTTGTRNIYDVAIDPFLNCFTRGNTNDGGGWNIRFLHHIQSGEYGYPRLFKNFSSEILPALEDLGGGSGVGSFFLSEPTWPAKYNNQPLMADWGRKAIYLHRLAPDGATFTQKAEEFAQVSQVTDLDVDPSGQMFVGAWDGAGYSGNPDKGYVIRLTPKGWTHRAFPDLATAKSTELLALLASPSATARFHAQQAILSRPAEAAALKSDLAAAARRASLDLAARVAALFTLAQIETDPRALLAFADDEGLAEFALRAATDRLSRLKGARLPLEPFTRRLQSGTPRQRVAAAVALGRLGDPGAAAALLAMPFVKPTDEPPATVTEKFTLKGNRDARATLSVKPGDDLRLHLTATDNPATPAKAALREAVFTLGDGSQVTLASLQPQSGRAAMITPPAEPVAAESAKKKKSGKQGRGAAPVLVVDGPGVVTYRVPPGAHAFVLHAVPAPDAGADASVDFFASTGEAGAAATAPAGAPRHATPNAGIVLPHVAAHAIARVRAIEPALAAVGTLSEDLALWALSRLHDEAVVDGLLAKLRAAPPPATRDKILTTLARLYQHEAPYDGSWWWGTRPDTRGPYYKPVTWSASPRIAAALEGEAARAESAARRDFLARLNDSHRLGLAKLGTRQAAASAAAPERRVDVAKLAGQKGAVANTAVEDAILAATRLPANHARGEALFTQQGCVACHALTTGGPALGPFMGQIGSIMNAEQIATAILRPNDTISQGFQTVVVTMKDGSTRAGFVTESTPEQVVLRDMTGAVTRLPRADVKEEKHAPTSTMPEGLANALSLEDFAALVQFLASKK